MLEHEDIVLTNVARGDNASFGVLFNHYYPKVRVYLTNVLEDKHSAQDIAQDIFAKIWLLRKTLPEIRDFGSYLFVMSRNSCLAHMKKRGRSTSIHDLELAEEHALDEMLHSDELRNRIFRIVDDMPSRRRQVFLMSREEAFNKLATLTGGRVAEDVVFNSITTGASNDIEQATKLARAMITRYGMSDDFDIAIDEGSTMVRIGTAILGAR